MDERALVVLTYLSSLCGRFALITILVIPTFSPVSIFGSFLFAFTPSLELRKLCWYL